MDTVAQIYFIVQISVSTIHSLLHTSYKYQYHCLKHKASLRYLTACLLIFLNLMILSFYNSRKAVNGFHPKHQLHSHFSIQMH